MRTDEALSALGCQPEMLVELTHARMPFGKYRDRLIIELPEAYLTWFQQRGWPNGRLGQLLATAFEIRINGLDELIRQIRRRHPQG